MATKKISELTAAATIAGTEQLPVVQAGATVRATVAEVLAPHVDDATAAHAGTAISNTPAGNIAATTVQAAINELDTEKVAKSGDTMTGNLTVPSLNGGQLAGLRNKIINGNFDVWQRRTSLTVSSAYSGLNFVADRFFSAADSGSSGSFTNSQQTFTPGQIDVPYEPTYFYRLATTSLVNATNGFTYLAQQRIEDVRTCAGQTVTVSFYAKASAVATICIALNQTFGTGGSGSVLVAPVTRSLTTSWQKITATFNVPSISDKTIGTSSCLSLEIFAALRGTTAAAYGVTPFDVLATGSYDIAQVQLEVGSVATPFEHRPYGMELALCRRYYYRAGFGAAFNLMGSGYCVSTTAARIITPFPVPLRISPTAVGQTGTATNYALASSTGVSVACSAVPAFMSASENFGQTAFTVASGLTGGDGTIGFAASGISTAYLEWSAEL